MTTIQLTDRGVRAAKTELVQQDLRDTVVRGLVLRVYQSGRKTWGVMYRTGEGRRRWYKLGQFPAVEVKTARVLAKEVLGKVAGGEDPQADRERARLRNSEAETIAELSQEYLERYARRHKAERSIRDDQWLIKSYVIPAWGRRKAAEIGRRDVKRLLEDLADGKIALRGRPTVTAPRSLRALLSKMFSWAVEEEILEINPAKGVPLPTKPTARDRVLSEEELKVLLAQLELLDSRVSAAAFRFLLLTAQRPGEVLNMQWSEVSKDWWTIPAERMKNRQSHSVPLSAQALATLDELRPYTGSSDWVFESPQKPGNPITTLKTSNHLVRRRGDMERWTPHDLRRTAATMMARMGISPFVVSKILGHTDPRGITQIYDRYSYDDEKRRALERWGQRVESMESGKTELAEVVNIG